MEGDIVRMQPKLLNETIAEQVREVFTQLSEPVEMLFFGQEAGCEYCEDTLQLVQEIVALSDKLSVEIYDIDKDAPIARQYKVDKAPGIVIAGRDGDQILDYGIRYAGIPAGHEFSSLVHDLILVSGRDSDWTTGHASSGWLTRSVLLQVFVTT
jgi:alkyl hydroperoxide reductase subunit AhpF